MRELLKTEHLSVSFFTKSGEVEAVRDVSLTVEEGEVLAIVGESGCGKSALCKSIMKLLPKTAKIKSGKILADGIDITDYTQRNMSRLRGDLFSMIFQDPMTALNPTMTIGKQIEEAVRIHNKKMPKKQVKKKVLELMQLVEIDEPEVRISQYPHEFSGGMRQRAVMAIALAGNPKILFADEPTTALDLDAGFIKMLDPFRKVYTKKKSGKRQKITQGMHQVSGSDILSEQYNVSSLSICKHVITHVVRIRILETACQSQKNS